MKHTTLLALLVLGCAAGAPEPAAPIPRNTQPTSSNAANEPAPQATSSTDDDDDSPPPAVGEPLVQPRPANTTVMTNSGTVTMLILRPSSEVPPADGGPYRLLRTFTSANGLISVRYSDDYKAQTIGRSVIQVSRKITQTLDEDLTWIPIPDPISLDLDEFTKVLIGAEIPELPQYIEVGRSRSTCFGVAGYEITAMWTSNNVRYKRWSCTFLRSNHGYSFAYDLPGSLAATNEPRLQAIIRGTVFARP